MNNLYELPRIQFVFNRDGEELAKKFAHQIVTNYLAAVRNWKSKPGGKNHPYRYGYIESACSARFILRNWKELLK